MKKCGFCQAEVAHPNYWHQEIAPNDNPNQKLDISKWPISHSSEMLAFCNSSCLSQYIHKYSGETITKADAKISGTPNNTTVKSVLNEPYRQDTKSKQQLNELGFKRLKNDGDKGDLRSEVGLSPQEASQQVIYQRLKTIKNMENKANISEAKNLLICDNCNRMIKVENEKHKGFEAMFEEPKKPGEKEAKLKKFVVCGEKCLGELITKRASRKKVKKNAKGEILVDMVID